MVKHALHVNGHAHALEFAPHTHLIDALRDHCGLKGTNQGCDTAQCGACTVLVDGTAVKSCNVLALQIAPHERVTTIEGITLGEGLHPMQIAFSQHHGLQCGYCTPGMILRAIAMHAEGVPAEPEAVRHALAGNLCRCTGYEGIVNAICAGLKAMPAMLPPAGAKGVGLTRPVYPTHTPEINAISSSKSATLALSPSPLTGQGSA